MNEASFNAAKNVQKEKSISIGEKTIHPLPRCPGSSGEVDPNTGKRPIVCSGHGTCIREPPNPCNEFSLYDPNLHEKLCSVRCICESGWRTQSCLITEQEFEQRKELREMLINAMSTMSASIEPTVEGLEQQSSMLEVLSSSPGELSPAAQNAVLNLALQSAEAFLKPDSLAGAMPNTVSYSLLGSLSNLIDSDMLDYSPGDSSPSELVENCNATISNCSANATSNAGGDADISATLDAVNRVRTTVEVVSRAQLIDVVPGEIAQNTSSRNLQMTSKRSDPNRLSDDPVAIPTAIQPTGPWFVPPENDQTSETAFLHSPSFNLPKLDDLLSSTESDSYNRSNPVDTLGVQWGKDPHEWSGRSMSSLTTGLVLRSNSGTEIKVEKASKPITFFLPRTAALIDDEPIEQSKFECPATLALPQRPWRSQSVNRYRKRVLTIGENYRPKRPDKIFLRARALLEYDSESEEPNASTFSGNNTNPPFFYFNCTNGFIIAHQCGYPNLTFVIDLENDEISHDPFTFANSSVPGGLNIDGLIVPFDYNITVECPRNITQSSCEYWDKDEGKWSTKGCQVVEITSLGTHCACTHLTDFASHLAVIKADAKAVLNTGSRLLTDPTFLFAKAAENWVVFLVMTVIGIALITCCCMSRRLDLIDGRYWKKYGKNSLNDKFPQITYQDVVSKRGSLNLLAQNGDDNMKPKHLTIQERNQLFFQERKKQLFGNVSAFRRWLIGMEKTHKYLSVFFYFDENFSRVKRVCVLSTLVVVSNVATIVTIKIKIVLHCCRSSNLLCLMSCDE